MKKLPLIISILSFFTITSCAETMKNYSIYYDIAMEAGSQHSEKKKDYKKLSPLKENLSLLFEDEIILVKWKMKKKGFWFLIRNKSNENIKILWSNAIFFDEENGNRRLISFKNLKYNNNSSTVIQKSFYDDFVFPEDYSNNPDESDNYIESGFRYPMAETYFPSIITASSNTNEEVVFNSLTKLYDRFVNKPIKILLPIQIDEQKIKEYVFSFNINEIKLEVNDSE